MSTRKLSLNDFAGVSVETLLEVKGAGPVACGGGGGKRGSGHRADRNAEQRAEGGGQPIPWDTVAWQAAKTGLNTVVKGAGTLIGAMLGSTTVHAPTGANSNYGKGVEDFGSFPGMEDEKEGNSFGRYGRDTMTPCIENNSVLPEITRDNNLNPRNLTFV